MKRIYLFLIMIFTQFQIVWAMAPAAAKDGTAKKGGGFSSLMVLFLPLLVIWYFLLIRPQQKKEKKKKQMMSDLKKGDKVMTIGGIYGQVVQVKDNRMTIKISEKANIEVSKTAISGKVD